MDRLDAECAECAAEEREEEHARELEEAKATATKASEKLLEAESALEAMGKDLAATKGHLGEATRALQDIYALARHVAPELPLQMPPAQLVVAVRDIVAIVDPGTTARAHQALDALGAPTKERREGIGEIALNPFGRLNALAKLGSDRPLRDESPNLQRPRRGLHRSEVWLRAVEAYVGLAEAFDDRDAVNADAVVKAYVKRFGKKGERGDA